MWDARAERVLAIHRVDDPGASELYLRWWFLAGKRFLCVDATHVDARMTQVPGEASQRVPTAHEPLLWVDDVPDNRRPERRMRVGTRTTARDWQWVNQAMEEDGEVDVAPRRVCRMLEAAIGRRCRGGRGGRGRDGGGGETRQSEDRRGRRRIPCRRAFRPASLEQQFGAEGAYYADLARCLQESPQGASGGSSSQAHAHTPVDLNETASDPFGDFSFALGGTPPSAFVDVQPTWMPMIRHRRPRRIRSLAGVAEPFAVGDVVRGATCSHVHVM
ncbi:hypothetical protein PIB30_084726 [Stylosanthes scabra]|uniref:Uncharacterized protein n=1 Tax=Stylosanthes scabra TaxID=79078 RepID=A0ABU6TS53_9FABA|nr:hypothetical protein [Stylosanthes scabra]